MTTLTAPKVATLRRQFKRLVRDGYRTATFVKVQARNHDVHYRTVEAAVYGYSWKDVEEPPYRPGSAA